MSKHLMGMNPLEFNTLPPELADNSFEMELANASDGRSTDAQHDEYILKAVRELKKRGKAQGYRNLFVPGTPFGIDKCPKHKAFFDATKDYRQIMFRAGNRTGKSVAGAFLTTLFAVQDYPDWWEGKVLRGPLSLWACGKTVQITRDTVQKEMLGPMGQIGTGMLPLDRIKKIWSRAGSPGSVDTVEIWNDYQDVTLIGFKSYDQGTDSFVGTAKHGIWEDEEPTSDVHNECLFRTATTGGIIYNTVTPISGLTEYIAAFDRGAAHLAGAQTIVNINDE